ncbi:MAG: hypothetical protein ACREFA_19980, partial [Stellaceae bacterium]
MLIFLALVHQKLARFEGEATPDSGKPIDIAVAQLTKQKKYLAHLALTCRFQLMTAISTGLEQAVFVVIPAACETPEASRASIMSLRPGCQSIFFSPGSYRSGPGKSEPNALCSVCVCATVEANPEFFEFEKDRGGMDGDRDHGDLGDSSLTLSSGVAIREQEVVASGKEGLPLGGTLVRPPRVPAMLLLQGSGPVDRDGNIPGVFATDLEKQIAEALA